MIQIEYAYLRVQIFFVKSSRVLQLDSKKFIKWSTHSTLNIVVILLYIFSLIIDFNIHR
jgi:hypothetical protein